MKLTSIRICRFRSIERASLEEIGGFNVLIGKNNSGKSNLLLALDSFFTCVKSGNLVTAEPPIGADIDFCGRLTNNPIELDLSFALEPNERDGIVSEIVSEAPQLKNVADGIDPVVNLSVSMRITNAPRRFAFVSNLSLKKRGAPNDRTTEILSLSMQAADELVSKYIARDKAKKLQALLEEVLQRFDPDDWPTMKEGSRTNSPRLRYLLRSASEPDTLELLERTIRETQTFADFRNVLLSYGATAIAGAEQGLRQSLTNKVGTFAGDATEIPKYAYSVAQRLGSLKVLYLKERRRPIGTKEAEQLLSLKVQRGGTEALHNIQETVSALLGVRIDAFNSDAPKKEAEMDVDDFLAEVNGSGIRESLRLVLDCEFRKPDIFLVEEPEIYLHPSLEISMMRYLKGISSSSQVFITTHSTNFLDTAEMKNVYLVSKPKSTSVQKVDLEDAETQIPQELGIRLSSLFLFDRLVFVEGPSDEAVLREFSAKLRINLSQAGVGFVQMGGVHNFGYFAAEQVISFLMKRNVKLWFLLDRDEKEETEISGLAKKCGGNATLKVLKKRELENYLILPRPLADFIAVKRRMANQSILPEKPSEAEIVAKLDEFADQLKPLSVEKRVAKVLCAPVFPLPKRLFHRGVAVGQRTMREEMRKCISELETAEKAIEQTYKDQTAALDSIWAINKLSLAPGDLLLDGVCQFFGVRFRKETDSSRLAALLSETEVDGEIRSILKEIGSA